MRRQQENPSSQLANNPSDRSDGTTEFALLPFGFMELLKLKVLLEESETIDERNRDLAQQAIDEPNEYVLAGKPVIRGTRLSVDFVIGLMADGWTEADILRNYLGVSHDDVAACLAYARDVLRSEKVYPSAA